MESRDCREKIRPDMDHEPEEYVQPQDEGELTLIDPEMFYDLLMEQQEQM